MTKPRQPLTQYRALETVSDLLGWETCAEIVELSVSQTRKLGDPDTGRELKYRDAIRLDAAYRQAGGNCSPFLDCHAARLGIDTTASGADAACLMMASGIAAKESGEAMNAVMQAATSGDSAARQAAIREGEEALQAWAALLHNLKSLVPGE
jgi:hypothetical protein